MQKWGIDEHGNRWVLETVFSFCFLALLCYHWAWNNLLDNVWTVNLLNVISAASIGQNKDQSWQIKVAFYKLNLFFVKEGSLERNGKCRLNDDLLRNHEHFKPRNGCRSEKRIWVLTIALATDASTGVHDLAR